MNFNKYFQTYNNYFWIWEENAEVMAIPKGSTIAYREFISQLLDALSEQGLPPFGSLILVIIATNETAESSLLQITNLITNFIKAEKNKIRQDNLFATFNNAMDFLNLLSSLPKQYKEGKFRSYLIQTLFSTCHNILAIDNSKSIVLELTNKLYESDKFINEIEFSSDIFHRDFWTIGLLIRKFPDTDSIINAIATVPKIINEIGFPKNAVKQQIQPNEFVQELINNSKTFHIGSLIRHIWAGLKFPYHHALPSELPLGGISDLTNKGDFDKLLISEFANDDLIFLSRLANNEALHLRREIPPSSDNTRRIILIDISIKNWGTPKILAYAILIAIAKHPKTDIKCTAFAIGNTFYPISFSTIEDLITSIAVMEPCLHSAQGLEAFFKANAKPKKFEIFFITSKETWKLPAMQKVISNFNTFFKYFITTNFDGNIEFYRNDNKSKKLLQYINLSINEIWQNKEIPSENKMSNATYPILFPNQYLSKSLNSPNGELFAIANKNILYRLINTTTETSKKGLEEVWNNLPIGEYEIGINKIDEIILLGYNPQLKELTIINLITKDVKKTPFTNWKFPFKRFFFFENTFHYITQSNHYIILHEQKLEIQKNNSIPDKISIAYKQREEELSELNKIPQNTYSILKSIKNIFLNNVHNLVFNTHELTINQNGIFRIQTTPFLQQDIAAKVSKKNEFVFPDGSIIKVSRAGMVILTSSNADIPDIFIPTALEMSLGIATHQYFAGNEFYYLDHTEIQKIDAREFWKNNIERFISNILLNATKDKAIS